MQSPRLVFGTRLLGELPSEFDPYLRSGPPQALSSTLSVRVRYRSIDRLPALEEFWVEDSDVGAARSRFALFDQPGGCGLSVNCLGCGLFRLTDEVIDIEWIPGGTGASHYFFSHALPLWLELKGVLVMHASAVSIGGKSAVFIGTSGAGKSTLAAWLVDSGFHFVSDDALAMRENEAGQWHCLPGPAMFRLWPNTCLRCSLVSRSPEQLARVHAHYDKRIVSYAEPDKDYAVADPEPAAIYLLERQHKTTGSAVITPLGAADSVASLIKHSLAGSPALALGLAASRLRKISRLVGRTRVKTLRYSPGRDQLDSMKKTILDDLFGCSIPDA